LLVSIIKIFCIYIYNFDTASTKTGCMHKSLPGTVPDSNFSLGVVEVMYDFSRMKSNEASAVIDSCLYTMFICVRFISVICIIPHEDCCEIVLCWIQIISVI